jgi:hypothetical protein
MAGQLHATQHQLTEQVADVERISRRIEPHVHTHRMIREARTELVGRRRVVNEAALVEFGEDVHASMLARPTAQMADHLNYVARRGKTMAQPELNLHDAMLVQALASADLGSQINVTILEGLARNLATGGIVHELTKDLTLRPSRDAVALRILGAAHREVLAGRAPLLARHYPSVGGTPGPTIIEDFLAVLETNRAAILDGLNRTVQTNEVGRTTMLVTGLAHFGRTYGVDTIHLREVGSSSGLNLLFDRFYFDNAAHSFGDPESKVRFTADAWGTPAVDISGCPTVDSRGGCDIAPLDIRDPERRLTLLSFVWPDQQQRFDRLHAALEIASTNPLYQPPTQADAADWIDEQLDGLADEPVVVFHSIVWQYFSQDTKDRFRNALRRHAVQRRAPIAWLRMEPAGAAPDLKITVWNNGAVVEDDHALATSSYHGIGVRRI